MIDKDKVNHIAFLGRLQISEEEMPKYQKQLSDILTEIEKIVTVDIEDNDIMISSTDNKNRYDDDIIGTHISKDLVLGNANNVKGDYIVVPKVIE